MEFVSFDDLNYEKFLDGIARTQKWKLDEKIQNQTKISSTKKKKKVLRKSIKRLFVISSPKPFSKVKKNISRKRKKTPKKHELTRNLEWIIERLRNNLNFKTGNDADKNEKKIKE